MLHATLTPMTPSSRRASKEPEPQFLITYSCPHCLVEFARTELEDPVCFSCESIDGMVEVRRQEMTPEVMAEHVQRCVEQMVLNLAAAFDSMGEGKGTAEETLLLEALAEGQKLKKGVRKVTKSMKRKVKKKAARPAPRRKKKR